MTRDKIQSEISNLAKYHNNMLLELGTGVGKTLCAIQVIEMNKDLHWGIVIAETTHELNWVNEFKKHNKEELLHNVTFFCYASLHKHLNYNAYVFDEIHHVFSEKRLELLSHLKFKKFIGLSATLTRNQKDSLSNIIKNYYTYKVTLSEAIDNDILPEPEVNFVGVTLDNFIKNEVFHFNKDKFVICTKLEKYNRLTKRVDWLKNKYFQTNSKVDKIVSRKLMKK